MKYNGYLLSLFLKYYGKVFNSYDKLPAWIGSFYVSLMILNLLTQTFKNCLYFLGHPRKVVTLMLKTKLRMS